jgi:hypothetical protein
LLNEQLAMTACHGGRDFALLVGAGGEERQRGHPANLGIPADRETVRRRDANPDAGEAARPHADDDGFGRASVEQLGDHRDKPLRMPAADDLVPARDALARPVEQGGGAGCTRRVEGEDHGERMMATCGAMPQAPKISDS